MKEKSSRRNQIMETQTTLKFPSLASVHFVDGSIERCMQSSSSVKSSPISVSHTSHKLVEIRLDFRPHSIFPTTERYATKEDLTFPILYSPFTLFCNSQDTQGSSLDISFIFSSLILSTLLWNPAVHAASTMEASFWPCTVDSLAAPLLEDFLLDAKASLQVLHCYCSGCCCI